MKDDLENLIRDLNDLIASSEEELGTEHEFIVLLKNAKTQLHLAEDVDIDEE